MALFALPHCSSLRLCLPHLTVAPCLPCLTVALFASPHCDSLPHLTVTASPHCGCVSVFVSPHCGSLYHLTVAVCLTSLWLSVYPTSLVVLSLFASPDSGSLCASPDIGSLPHLIVALFCLTLLWLSLFASLHSGSLLLCVCCLSCSLSTSKCTHHTAQDKLPGCPSEYELLTQLLASVLIKLMPSSPPPLLISLSFHNCTLPVTPFVPVLVPASSNFQYL